MGNDAIYARQSADKKDSLSVDDQIVLCRRECEGEPEIYMDRGFSAKNTDRPDFKRLMEDIEKGKIKRLVCYRIDRVSRSITDFGRIWDTLSARGVEFVSVNEKFDTASPIGRAMLYIIMVFAQLERETIAERIKDNYYQRVRRGIWPGGPAPYGLEIIPKDEWKNGACGLRPNNNIDVVTSIFDLYATPGASLGKVAKYLNSHDIPCTQRKNWDTISVYRVLRHPAYVKADASVYAYYKGKNMIIYNDLDEFTGSRAAIIVGKRLSSQRKYSDMTEHLLALASHKGVVDSGTFLACQYKLDQNKQIKNTGKGRLTWLSGLLKCGRCGYSLKVQRGSRPDVLYLVCSGRTNLDLCDLRHSERVPDAEAEAQRRIIARLAELKMQQDNGKLDSTDNLSELRSRLAQADAKIANLIASLAEASNVTMRYINAEIARLEGERTALNLELAKHYISFDLKELLNIDFPVLSFEGKKAIAQLLIERVLCSPDGFKVIWKA